MGIEVSSEHNTFIKFIPTSVFIFDCAIERERSQQYVLPCVHVANWYAYELQVIFTTNEVSAGRCRLFARQPINSQTKVGSTVFWCSPVVEITVSTWFNWSDLPSVPLLPLKHVVSFGKTAFIGKTRLGTQLHDAHGSLNNVNIITTVITEVGTL